MRLWGFTRAFALREIERNDVAACDAMIDRWAWPPVDGVWNRRVVAGYNRIVCVGVSGELVKPGHSSNR